MKTTYKNIVILFVAFLLLTGCDLFKPESVKKVEDLIVSIGEVTLESENLIVTAETGYNELTDKEKEQVENYENLKNARETYDELVKDNKVNIVIKSIDAIGEVSLDKKDLISAARKNYDNLDVLLKERITNYDVLESAEKKYNDLKQNLISSKLKVLKKEYDKVQGITWYSPSAMPKYIDSRCYLLPYIGINKTGYSWLIIRYNYTEDDWVFWKKAIILVDGVQYTKTVSYFSVTRDNEYGVVWESYDDVNVTNNYIEMLRNIAKSKETIVRFQGDDYYWDYKIPSKDKTAIKQVLEAYDALNK